MKKLMKQKKKKWQTIEENVEKYVVINYRQICSYLYNVRRVRAK